MIIKQKTIPIGIDKSIDKCQRRLNERLSWGDDIKIYGRLYLVTNRERKVIAQAYNSGISYHNVFVDNNEKAIIGFVERKNRIENKTAFIDIVCSLMLDKIYPDETDFRNDEEALQEVVKIVKSIGGWNIESIRVGEVSKVFEFMDTSSILFRDMQPYANFAISCKVNYLNNICKKL